MDGITAAAGSTTTIAGVGTLQMLANGSFTFTPNAAYDGSLPAVTYTITDGTTTATAQANFGPIVSGSDELFEQLVTQRNPFGDGLDPNRPDPLAIRSPVIPIGMPEDLFVTHSVRESAMRIAQNSGFGVSNVDAPTRGELDNLTYDLKGLPIGMDNTLFVQHAVRSLPITQEPRLFVQNAVRQSQLESTMRNIGTNSFNSATAGVTSLLSPFDLGSPNDVVDLSVDAVNSDFAKKSADATNQPRELALDASSESVVDKDFNKLESPSDKVTNTTAKEVSAKLLETQLSAEAKKVAAASFANQLNAASRKFKASDIFNKSN